MLALLPRLAGLVVALTLAAPALAQAPAGGAAPPTRIRGAVADLVGDKLTVAARDGSKVEIALIADTRITGVVKLKLADIKPGDFVAVGGTRTAGGVVRALQINVTPGAGSRAAETGFQGPWAPATNGVMTNANVAAIEGAAGAAEGQTLKLTYKDGAAEIVVPPEAFIATFVAADRSLLKPGADVSVGIRRTADGKFEATLVQAEKDGQKLPPL
ncbi:MAG: DUF5666 domain-containing protein [Bauldia sp.]